MRTNWLRVRTPVLAKSCCRQALTALSEICRRCPICLLARPSKPFCREIPNSLQSSAIGSPASHKLQPFVHYRILLPRHHSPPPKKGRKCNLGVRYDLSLMSRVAHKPLWRQSCSGGSQEACASAGCTWRSISETLSEPWKSLDHRSSGDLASVIVLTKLSELFSTDGSHGRR